MDGTELPARTSGGPEGALSAAPVREADQQAVFGDGFHRLFMDRFGAMVSLARLLGAEDPDGVAQEAFLKLFAAGDVVRDQAAYLRRTVVNLSRNSLRHRLLGRGHVAQAAVTRSAESSAFARQDVVAALTAIEQLPRRRREALVLRHWLGLSYEEIAAALGVSPTGARSLTSRARADVHQYLHQEGQP